MVTGCESVQRQLAKPDGADILDGAALATPATVDGRFELVDTSGRRVNEASYDGRARLVYLGYTSCPEICGMELETMSAAADEAGGTPDNLVMLFVTVDPRRDTAERLATFLAHFHPTLVGLRGDDGATTATARSFGAYFQRNDDMSEQYYTVDHSTFIYLFDADGRFVRSFSYQSNMDDIAAELARVLPARGSA